MELRDAEFPKHCRRQANVHVVKSVCGVPDAVICCRADGTGNTDHAVEKLESACVDHGPWSTCISDEQSLFTGCSTYGCIESVCNNGILEPAEDCDLPDGMSCSEECTLQSYCGDGVVNGDEDCEPPATQTCEVRCLASCDAGVPAECGNLVIDSGETCEPPGAGSCGHECQAASCSPATGSEIDVTCAPAGTTVSAAGNATGYMVTWTGTHRRYGEILSRHLDSGGVGSTAPLAVATSDQRCGASTSASATASDGSTFYVVWSASDEAPGSAGFTQQWIMGRRIDDGSMQAPDEIVSHVPVGVCRTSIAGPVAAAGAGPSRFAAAWHVYATCSGSPMFDGPAGAFLDFDSGFAETGAGIGYGPPTGPPYVAADAAAMDSLGGSTLWSWHAGAASSPSGPYQDFVGAQWSDGDTASSPFSLGSRAAVAAGGRPVVSAGAATFLVAWSQGATSSLMTEIRAMRVSRASGALDPDGGLLLASVPAGVTAGPVAAYDGARWLVAWTQPDGSGGYEVRAVAVDDQGNALDPSPRLIASNVVSSLPAAASAGDGKVLVVFARTQGAFSAVRGLLVQP
ncbi:MAG TPA: hypothetical protein VEL28_17095 [Candidatus Binatia bacterium]|nr:hypothetical protein [Candidatus Binatia bacterium]